LVVGYGFQGNEKGGSGEGAALALGGIEALDFLKVL
jgi:hypothetical protein